MVKISKQLKASGFNVDLLENVIERNKGLLKYDTLNLFCIYLVLSDFTMMIDERQIKVKSGNAIFVGQHRSIEYVSSHCPNIYVVVFTAAFYERSKKDSSFLNSSVFFRNHGEVLIAPYFGSEQYIKTALIERLQYFYEKKEKLYLTVAHSAIESLILDALSITDVSNDIGRGKSDYYSVGNHFQTLLQKDFRDHKNVSHYAGQLRVSVKKLTEITRKLYGESAKQIIISKICKESELVLVNSNITISELAYDLGFSCESNFTHFIKKHTGKNPSEIRL